MPRRNSVKATNLTDELYEGRSAPKKVNETKTGSSHAELNYNRDDVIKAHPDSKPMVIEHDNEMKRKRQKLREIFDPKNVLRAKKTEEQPVMENDNKTSSQNETVVADEAEDS